MDEVWKYLLILNLTLTSLKGILADYGSADEELECPTWYLPVNSKTGTPNHCKCGSELDGIVRCEQNHTVRLSVLHCMTSEPSTGTIEGYCPFGHIIDTINTAFELQPSNTSELTEFTCSWLNRTGPLCSQCENPLGAAVFSYSFGCVKCLGKLRGWFLYLFLALFPLTIFFFVIIVCNIDATAPHMNSLLCIMQILIFSLNTNSQSFLQTGKTASKSLAVIAWTIVGFWNLDILRYVYPSFCIIPEMSALQVMSLEYIVALYPLVLILAAYALIELHDNDYRLVRLPWFVVRKCLNRLKHYHHVNLDPKLSIIKYFSTFLLLAYSKILFVSLNLLAVTNIYKIDGTILNGSSRVFYNASIEYLSREHLPYFILATITIFVFNVLPLLILVFYPLKIFQKILASCKCIRWHPLRAFADKFQGCYKDGTNKSLDYRYFAGIFLLIRILYHLHVVINNRYSVFFTQVIPLVSAVLFGVLHPYKNDLYNRLDSAFFSILTLGQICLATNRYVASLPITMLYIFAAIPLAYLLLLIIHKSLALCVPKFTLRVKQFLRTKLLRKNFLFLPEPELTMSYDQLGDSDDLIAQADSRIHVTDNPIRHLLPFLSRAANKEPTRKKKTTYSSCEISP